MGYIFALVAFVLVIGLIVAIVGRLAMDGPE